jgi:hypothetical protein
MSSLYNQTLALEAHAEICYAAAIDRWQKVRRWYGQCQIGEPRRRSSEHAIP